MNLCCCCLTRAPQMDLKTPYIRLGVTEIFSEMLEQCFKFRLFTGSDQCGICSVCVGRLQDASDFKQQVERCQAELWARLEGHAKSKYKEQACGAPAVKAETPDDGTSEKGDIWIPVLMSESVSPAPQVVCTMDKLISSSVSRACSKQTSCKSYENQFTIFCLSNAKKPVLKPKQKRIETEQERLQKPTQRERSKEPSTAYSCGKCRAVFPKKHLLIEHKRTHKTKDHTCHICSKKFMKKYRLNDHIRAHNGHKPYMCEICSKNFTSVSNLWAHKQTHRGLVFICDHCGKKCIRRSDIVAHMNVHTDTLFKCHCGLKFAYKSAFKSHEVVHSQVKHFTCDVCGKQFRRKDHLATHELIHSGEKPYCCGLCDQKFTTKSNVKRHKMKVHVQKNP